MSSPATSSKTLNRPPEQSASRASSRHSASASRYSSHTSSSSYSFRHPSPSASSSTAASLGALLRHSSSSLFAPVVGSPHGSAAIGHRFLSAVRTGRESSISGPVAAELADELAAAGHAESSTRYGSQLGSLSTAELRERFKHLERPQLTRIELRAITERVATILNGFEAGDEDEEVEVDAEELVGLISRLLERSQGNTEILAGMQGNAMRHQETTDSLDAMEASASTAEAGGERFERGFKEAYQSCEHASAKLSQVHWRSVRKAIVMRADGSSAGVSVSEPSLSDGSESDDSQGARGTREEVERLQDELAQTRELVDQLKLEIARLAGQSGLDGDVEPHAPASDEGAEESTATPADQCRDEAVLPIVPSTDPVAQALLIEVRLLEEQLARGGNAEHLGDVSEGFHAGGRQSGGSSHSSHNCGGGGGQKLRKGGCCSSGRRSDATDGSGGRSGHNDPASGESSHRGEDRLLPLQCGWASGTLRLPSDNEVPDNAKGDVTGSEPGESVGRYPLDGTKPSSARLDDANEEVGVSPIRRRDAPEAENSDGGWSSRAQDAAHGQHDRDAGSCSGPSVQSTANGGRASAAGGRASVEWSGNGRTARAGGSEDLGRLSSEGSADGEQWATDEAVARLDALSASQRSWSSRGAGAGKIPFTVGSPTRQDEFSSVSLADATEAHAGVAWDGGEEGSVDGLEGVEQAVGARAHPRHIQKLSLAPLIVEDPPPPPLVVGPGELVGAAGRANYYEQRIQKLHGVIREMEHAVKIHHEDQERMVRELEAELEHVRSASSRELRQQTQSLQEQATMATTELVQLQRAAAAKLAFLHECALQYAALAARAAQGEAIELPAGEARTSPGESRSPASLQSRSPWRSSSFNSPQSRSASPGLDHPIVASASKAISNWAEEIGDEAAGLPLAAELPPAYAMVRTQLSALEALVLDLGCSLPGLGARRINCSSLRGSRPFGSFGEASDAVQTTAHADGARTTERLRKEEAAVGTPQVLKSDALRLHNLLLAVTTLQKRSPEAHLAPPSCVGVPMPVAAREQVVWRHGSPRVSPNHRGRMRHAADTAHVSALRPACATIVGISKSRSAATLRPITFDVNAPVETLPSITRSTQSLHGRNAPRPSTSVVKGESSPSSPLSSPQLLRVAGRDKWASPWRTDPVFESGVEGISPFRLQLQAGSSAAAAIEPACVPCLRFEKSGSPK